jgi:hypothetical protein
VDIKYIQPLQQYNVKRHKKCTQPKERRKRKKKLAELIIKTTGTTTTHGQS